MCSTLMGTLQLSCGSPARVASQSCCTGCACLHWLLDCADIALLVMGHLEVMWLSTIKVVRVAH